MLRIYQFYFIPMATIFEKQDRTSVWKNVEKLEPLCIAGRNVKWCSCYGKHCGTVPQRVSTGLETRTQTLMPMLITLFTIAKRWELDCSLPYDCINNEYIYICIYTHTQWSVSHKKVYVYTHNEMSVIKRNELLIHAITWKESWRHVKWNKPDTKWQILYDFTRIGAFMETKSRMMVTRRCGREAGWGVAACWLQRFCLGW